MTYWLLLVGTQIKKGSAKKYARKAVELNPDDQRLIDNYQFIMTKVAKDFKDNNAQSHSKSC